jgi:hypothetical protein
MGSVVGCNVGVRKQETFLSHNNNNNNNNNNSDMAAINSSDRIAATLCSLGTRSVSGIYV